MAVLMLVLLYGCLRNEKVYTLEETEKILLLKIPESSDLFSHRFWVEQHFLPVQGFQCLFMISCSDEYADRFIEENELVKGSERMSFAIDIARGAWKYAGWWQVTHLKNRSFYELPEDYGKTMIVRGNAPEGHTEILIHATRGS